MIHPCNKPCGNKTASGYCATTACINPKYSNIGTAHYGQGVQKCIVTNADRIRAMTDEELARWIATTADDNCPDTAHERYCDNRCGECWLDWLKSPVYGLSCPSKD